MRKLVPAVLAVCLAACGSGGSTVTTARDAASPAALAAVPGDICKQLQEGIEVPVIPIAGTLRVLAFGDFGTGLPAQRNVALGMAKQAPYHFGITLGDNFYPKGINSIKDPRWKSQWEDLYSPLKIRVYATLGNHDHWDPQSPKAERDYSSMSQTWCLPMSFFGTDGKPVPESIVTLRKGAPDPNCPR